MTGASYEFLPALDELSDELLAVAKDEKKKKEETATSSANRNT